MKTDWKLYEDLELAPETASEPKSNNSNWKTNWKTNFHNLLQFLGKVLTSGQEPRIWERTDRTGNTRWYVYSPITGYTACLSSEQEVRMWLEQYYRIGW
ncbi:hypothetical protein K9N68_09960 [Kovacikia minuta CCNUW1]|uniref:hypothetical protein n=1 Tax=Kovacikia minuta TaxID=2931930 RepID=UPI001CCB9787|nr:hypothetical protein [Kovacikia minuta]UBF28172.1 hypothetical protein K9N68_09960 [Kovacikia minuta CCNUW1]